MEDYDKFVEYYLSQMRKKEEENSNRHIFASSIIRFYGKPILPPVLSGKQREEMQRHRDEAQKAAKHTKSKEDPRMAAVQTILHSVQLRKMPTLEELLKESEICSKLSSCKSNSGSVSHSVFSKDSLVSSPPSEQKEMDAVSLPPLTSTTCSAFFTSHIKSHLSNCEGSLINQHDNQQGSLPTHLNDASHQSISSGYMTYENVENTISVSGQIDTRSDSHDFVSTERSESMGGFFLHNTSDTIAKMPDIISYPPVDGQELEKSGLELSICNHVIAGDTVEDVCSTFFQDNSVTCAHLPFEKSTTSFLDGAESKENTVFSTVLDQDSDRNDSIGPSLKNSEVTNSLQMDNYTLAELHIQPGEAKPADNPVDEADSKLSKKPYRLSLQALLKKSQEYRKRQQMLRIQAKNTKIQERTREQPKGKVEEQSLSDKENDEYSNMGTVTAEQKKSKERCGTFIPTGVEMSLKKSWEKSQSEEILVKPRFTFESTQHFDIITSVEEETASRNNRLNATEFNGIDSFPQQEPTWTENTCLAPSFKVAGKFHTIPAPTFCRSPVHCKVKGSSKSVEGAIDNTFKRELLITSERNVDQKVKDGNGGQQSSPTAALSTVNVVVESDVTSILAKRSQHLDQLEFNLSGLKVLISDLETTLTENMDKNCSQTESSLKSNTCCESGQRIELGQNDSVHGEDDDDNDSSNKDHKDREFLSRQSLDSCKNMCEEKSIYQTDELPVVEQDIQTEAISLREIRLFKTLTTEREKESSTGTGFTKSCGQDGDCRKQQPPGKHILSTAQRMRVPDIFRTRPSETTAPHNLCVLSDTSNHLVQRNEVDVEHHDYTRSPSLNQSYDVDTPSQLWLQEGSGSDSKGHLVPEKHLTPENGVEDQSGLSKVKRKLLMHVSEDIMKRGGNISRKASPVPRPTSSTPKAAVWWREGHGSRREKQEQLKQVHAAQVRALQEEHRRQQEELIQALAVRCRLLQSVSFPCSMSTSHLGNTLTFPTISQASLSRSLSSVPERYRPLLVAAVKGFLTRRLLKTDRVAQLVRTIRDTWQFLLAFRRGEQCNKQDFLLQERVTLQLRAARYEVYDIFFSLSDGERMQLISWDRELNRERALKRQSGFTGHPRGKRFLSAATQKTLERKRGIM
uniref:Centriolar coiled-coil protein 110 n=2 Tax=Sphaeramia orbicularis TaxID=375764 RepID=A0A672Y9L1_9TELE